MLLCSQCITAGSYWVGISSDGTAGPVPTTNSYKNLTCPGTSASVFTASLAISVTYSTSGVYIPVLNVYRTINAATTNTTAVFLSSSTVTGSFVLAVGVVNARIGGLGGLESSFMLQTDD